MAKQKKPFSEKAFQSVLTKARAEGKNRRFAVIALFEKMETKSETRERKLSDTKANAKAKADVKAKAIVKASDEAEMKITAVPRAVAKPKIKAKLKSAK